jgi:hypothetical protein
MTLKETTKLCGTYDNGEHHLLLSNGQQNVSVRVILTAYFLVLSCSGEKGGKTPWLMLPALKAEPSFKSAGVLAAEEEMCGESSAGARPPEAPGLHTDSVSPSLPSKNKGIPEKMRAGTHPKSLSVSLSPSCTLHM